MNAERCRRLKVDYQLELGGLLDGQIGRLCTVEASSICCACLAAGGKLGLTSAPTKATPGASSRNRPNLFASIKLVDVIIPVALPPGRLMLSTRPALTGSLGKRDWNGRGGPFGGDRGGVAA
jgi:hypothetical protein